MAQPVIDFSDFVQTITDTVGLQASTKTFLDGVQQLVTAAVTKAIQEDDAGDQGTVDAAVSALAAEFDKLKQSNTALAAALAANQPPTQ